MMFNNVAFSDVPLDAKLVEKISASTNLSESWMLLTEDWFSSTICCSSPKTTELFDTIKLLRS